MIETIFLSVILFILALLAIIELWYCRSQHVAGWEAKYYSKRLKRRLSGLFLLMLIVLTVHFSDDVRLFLHGLWWNLVYLFSCLALILVVFILVIKDILETSRYLVRKNSEIAAQSLRRLKENSSESDTEEDS